MNKAYNKINWQNQPSTSTALGATNLNKMDNAINTIDDRVITLDTTKLDLTTANSMVKSFALNQATGVITITMLNGTVTTYDTKLEKLAVNFSYDSTAQQLVITLDDGTKQYVDMSALITQYEFSDSSTVGFTVTDGKVGASVKDGSITAEKLQPNYLADITVQSQIATTQANKSQRYSVGGVETGDTEDNAKYYKEQAELFKNQAKTFRDEAEDISGVGIATDTKLGLVKSGGNIEINNDGTMNGADMFKSVYDPTNKHQDVFKYVDDNIKSKFDANTEIEFVEATVDADIVTKDTLPTIIGKLVKSIKTFRANISNLTTNIGTLSFLATTVKTSLVNAINELVTNKINVSDIVNNDTTGGTNKVASAETVKVLGQEVDTLNNNLAFEPWKNAILLNGWTGVLHYAKNGRGQVKLRMSLNTGTTVSAGTIIAVLPEGYRPSYVAIIPVFKANISPYDTQLGMNMLNNGNIIIREPLTLGLTANNAESTILSEITYYAG